jgi:hypothetical protein
MIASKARIAYLNGTTYYGGERHYVEAYLGTLNDIVRMCEVMPQLINEPMVRVAVKHVLEALIVGREAKSRSRAEMGLLNEARKQEETPAVEVELMSRASKLGLHKARAAEAQPIPVQRLPRHVQHQGQRHSFRPLPAQQQPRSSTAQGQPIHPQPQPGQTRSN